MERSIGYRYLATLLILIRMAKIELNIEFDNEKWKPIKISTETSDKNAYRIYRLVIPKKTDFKEEKPKEEPKPEEKPSE